VRSAEDYNTVQRLIAAGLNDCAIARQTGIPRRTVWDWRCRPRVEKYKPAGSSDCGIDHDFSCIAAAPYCYVLGLAMDASHVTRGPGA
jgi:hypothetical protein